MSNNFKIQENEKPATIEQIEKFEKRLGVTLPKDYKNFLFKNNGGHPVYDTFKLEIPINKINVEGEIAWFYALYDGDECNIIKQMELNKGRIPEEFLAIGYDPGGEICLGIKGEHYDHLYYWTTNWSYWKPEDLNNLCLICKSFKSFINGLYKMTSSDDNTVTREYQNGQIIVSKT